MALHCGNRQINRIGVVGSGQIGPDIALHFAKAAHRHGVEVVVVDVAPEALDRGRDKLAQKVAKGRASGAFSEEEAAGIGHAVRFTGDYEALRGAELVVEAATERLEVKRSIFARLEAVCGPEAVLASNSSHLEPDEIFTDLSHPERALILHYFYPAERNPLVEIVTGRGADPALAGDLARFYQEIGKVPVAVGGRYGYAVNPVFEGLFLAAALAVEEGLGTTREVDAAARRALGLGVGPFTAMNLTGGNPITAHALGEMSRRFGSWWQTPRLLTDALAAGTPWDVAGRGEEVTLPPDREEAIADTMRGAYFGLTGQVLDAGIISLADLEMAVELGLAMAPPFAAMNDLGVADALALVEAYAARHSGFQIPSCLAGQAARGQPFRIDQVIREDRDGVAVLTIRRPRVLNALSEEVYRQLHEHFTALRDDPAILGVVLTGFGTKAFVSGADVHFLAAIRSPEEGAATSERSKAAGNLIEGLGKPVVCALNGFALGGGLELALCCTARIVRAGLPLAVAAPETNLGIIPGAGATQRLPRLVDLPLAAEMLRTGRGLSGPEAVAAGLVREEVTGDLIAAAVDLARGAARGEVHFTPLDPSALETPDQLPTVELGHRSRAIDALMCRAVVEGCRLPLADGLRFESEMFGACCATEDMRIGVRTFLEQGPRARAGFVHR